MAMAATISIHCWAGDPLSDGGAIAGGADLCSDDNCEYSGINRTNNPITRGEYSYEKWLLVHVTVSPANWIGRFKVWGNGGEIPIGTTLRVGAVNIASAPIAEASSVAVNDFSTILVGNKFVWDNSVYTPDDLFYSPQIDYYLVFQLYASAAAVAGDWGPVTVNYEYQEV
jgi:hypothetical protein